MEGIDVKKIREKLGLTQTELADKIGVSRGTIVNYENGGVIPESKRSILNNLIDSSKQIMNNAKPLEDFDFMMVPVVYIPAQAGYPKGAGNQEYINQLPTMPVIVDKNYKGKYRVFEVNGDSMDDSSRKAIYDKDKILCREVPFEMWKSKLHINDWYFVIVLREGDVTVKQIIDHNVETGDILCHPLNSLFDDFTINLADVVELYNVIKIVDRNSRI